MAAGAANGAAAGLLINKATGGSKTRHYATGALGGALVGAPTANQQLSERRAAAVQNHMQGRSLERARVSFEGRGPNEPAASNGDKARRLQNRRVESFVQPPAS